MGSIIEINDTLQLSFNQGFPAELQLSQFLSNPVEVSKKFLNQTFSFAKEDIRIYHPAPTRVFLVQNIDGKWIYWGHALVIEQTINSELKTTSGKFKIIKLYSPEYMKMVTENESPEGRGFLFGRAQLPLRRA